MAKPPGKPDLVRNSNISECHLDAKSLICRDRKQKNPNSTHSVINGSKASSWVMFSRKAEASPINSLLSIGMISTTLFQLEKLCNSSNNVIMKKSYLFFITANTDFRSPKVTLINQESPPLLQEKSNSRKLKSQKLSKSRKKNYKKLMRKGERNSVSPTTLPLRMRIFGPAIRIS